MHRIVKLLWIIIILWIVSFIICDEKWIKISLQNNRIILNKIAESSVLSGEIADDIEKLQPTVVYKNSDIIHIYNWFNNPYELSRWAWINSELISMLANWWSEGWWTKIIDIDDENKISNSLVNIDTQNIVSADKYNLLQHKLNLSKSNPYSFIEVIPEVTWANTDSNLGQFANDWEISNWSVWDEITSWNLISDISVDIPNSWNIFWIGNNVKPADETGAANSWKNVVIWNASWSDNVNHIDKINAVNSYVTTWSVSWVVSWNYNDDIVDHINEINTWENMAIWNVIPSENLLISWDISDISNNSENISSWSENRWWDWADIAWNWEITITQWVIWNEVLENPIINTISVNKYRWYSHLLRLSSLVKKEIIDILVSIDRYESNSHSINLQKWKILEHEFRVEDDSNLIDNSSSIFDDLLTKDEIDIQTLESENEEFLQKVFEETRDVKVMNLIVETYLNEYQFIKAKRFIENLPTVYSEELDSSLYLRVAFNSFSLSSKSYNNSLNDLVDKYANDNSISDEEKKWYKWVIALMQQDYDSFFEISRWFMSEKYKTFASKIEWYRDQTSKQMWMPWYYFDTLVALELFNQWLFQPAKVLALSSLQQNSKYILPYQVLAYANFLTNSWDTCIEYLKKLTDLDPNNAEKYRFLMWIAYYRNEKYEQSVLMLSMIKDEKLRLDVERYLIRDYLLLDQKNKLISSRWKLLWYDGLVTSDFYTYFYEVFYRPYSEWAQYEIYAYDTELAEKMLRVCNLRLSWEDRVICSYWNIGKSIALGQFDWLENSLLSLAVSYPQSYLYHALWEYYINQWDFVKAKAYLIKAVSMAQKRWEVSQIKKLLQSTLQ